MFELFQKYTENRAQLYSYFSWVMFLCVHTVFHYLQYRLQRKFSIFPVVKIKVYLISSLIEFCQSKVSKLKLVLSYFLTYWWFFSPPLKMFSVHRMYTQNEGLSKVSTILTSCVKVLSKIFVAQFHQFIRMFARTIHWALWRRDASISVICGSLDWALFRDKYHCPDYSKPFKW